MMHYGVKYADRNSSQPPSVIPRGGVLEDAAFPSRRVEFIANLEGADWVRHPMIEPAELVTQEGSPALKRFESEAGALVGRRVGLLLPFEVERTLNE